MRIEKLNENQIRATLSREDLESRHLRMSEFAYGTEAARSLFQELLRFASYRLGFEVDDTPLMVEAIPLSSESIVLIITKIPYPEELDTRFSRFSDVPDSDEYGYGDYYEEAEYDPKEIYLDGEPVKATDIIDVSAVDKTETDDAASNDTPAAPRVIPDSHYTRMFRFATIDDLFTVAGRLAGCYQAPNTLFHTTDGYILIVHIGDHDAASFNRVVNTLAEYGTSVRYTRGTEDYLREHVRPVVAERALQVLATI